MRPTVFLGCTGFVPSTVVPYSWVPVVTEIQQISGDSPKSFFCYFSDLCTQSLHILSEMDSKGLDPDVLAYYIALRACERAQQWEQVARGMCIIESQFNNSPSSSSLFIMKTIVFYTIQFNSTFFQYPTTVF